jgi:hypothetical protein
MDTLFDESLARNCGFNFGVFAQDCVSSGSEYLALVYFDETYSVFHSGILVCIPLPRILLKLIVFFTFSSVLNSVLYVSCPALISTGH